MVLRIPFTAVDPDPELETSRDLISFVKALLKKSNTEAGYAELQVYATLAVAEAIRELIDFMGDKDG